MITIEDALECLRAQSHISADAENPFTLVSSFAKANVTRNELACMWREKELPKDLVDLWSTLQSARLFEDTDYGQWGLILLSPAESRKRTLTTLEERPGELQNDDFVIGEFLGDQDLLVLAPSEVGARRVLVATPLDHRADWSGVGADLATFLYRFCNSHGQKFWES